MLKMRVPAELKHMVRDAARRKAAKLRHEASEVEDATRKRDAAAMAACKPLARVRAAMVELEAWVAKNTDSALHDDRRGRYAPVVVEQGWGQWTPPIGLRSDGTMTRRRSDALRKQAAEVEEDAERAIVAIALAKDVEAASAILRSFGLDVRLTSNKPTNGS